MKLKKVSGGGVAAQVGPSTVKVLRPNKEHGGLWLPPLDTSLVEVDPKNPNQAALLKDIEATRDRR